MGSSDGCTNFESGSTNLLCAMIFFSTGVLRKKTWSGPIRNWFVFQLLILRKVCGKNSWNKLMKTSGEFIIKVCAINYLFFWNHNSVHVVHFTNRDSSPQELYRMTLDVTYIIRKTYTVNCSCMCTLYVCTS